MAVSLPELAATRAGVRKMPAPTTVTTMRAATSMVRRAGWDMAILALQELASDDHALDLVGSFVDLHDLGLAHETLHRKLPRVADPTEDLHGIGSHLHGAVGREALGHRRLQHGRGYSAVHQLGHVVNHQARGVDLNGHVRQDELKPLERRDRLAKLLPLLRIARGGIEGGLGDPHRGGTRHRAGIVEGAHGDLEAFALGSQAVFGWHLTVLQMESDGRRRTDTHL